MAKEIERKFLVRGDAWRVRQRHHLPARVSPDELIE